MAIDINLNNVQPSTNTLASGSTPLAGTEEVPIYQGGGDKKVTVQDIADLASGSNIGNADLTISTSGARKLILGGALSTDYFTIRDSADTTDYFKVQGDGDVYFESTSSSVWFGTGNGRIQTSASGNMTLRSANLVSCTLTGTLNASSQAITNIEELNIGGSYDGNGTHFAQFLNGTAPASTTANSFKMYSADQAAGNACPHFYTENGSIVKLYQETTGVSAATFTANTSGIADDTATWGGYTMGQVVQALQNHGLLA